MNASYISGEQPKVGDLIVCVDECPPHLRQGRRYPVTRIVGEAVEVGNYCWSPARFSLIGHGCWYQQGSLSPWRRGIHPAWSTDFENGDIPYQFPVAVIEDCETHHVHSIYVTRVAFTPEAPT